jgi:hypothetical protein
MGNGSSKTDINPYIFFPINTGTQSVRSKIDQTLKYADGNNAEFTFERNEMAKFINDLTEDTENKYIETYGDSDLADPQTSAVRVVLVCKDEKGDEEAVYDKIVKASKVYKVVRGGNNDDSSDSSSSTSSFIGDESSDSSDSSESTSDKEKKKHKKHKKEKKEHEDVSEGGSFHSYSLPTINSSDIRNMADDNILTTNSIMEEAVNKYNKLQKKINLATSERDLISDSDNFVTRDVIKNNKYL